MWNRFPAGALRDYDHSQVEPMEVTRE